MKRPVEQVRQAARCKSCGEIAAGVTTICQRPWNDRPAGYSFHFCDACSSKIVERPLEAVIADIAGSEF